MKLRIPRTLLALLVIAAVLPTAALAAADAGHNPAEPAAAEPAHPLSSPTETKPAVTPVPPHDDPAMPMAPARGEPLDLTTNRVLVVGGEAFVESLLTFFVAVLWLLLVALQFARPYILNIVRKFSLRLGADLWWLGYVLIRDLVMVVTFILSFFYYYPMLVEERPFPVLAPLATTVLFAALVIKLVSDADDDYRAFKRVTALIAVGSVLFLSSAILGPEARSVDVLRTLSRFLVSEQNPAFAYTVLWISLAGFAGLAVYAVGYTLRSARSAAR